MKYFLMVLTFALSAWSFQASSATCTAGADCGLITSSADLGRSEIGAVSFIDTYTFSVSANDLATFTVTNIKTPGLINNFTATLDGNSLGTLNDVGSGQFFLASFTDLAVGGHKLVVSGTGIGRSSQYGGLISITQSEEPIPEVPVPAAVWLFGSALIGLLGIKRRQLHVA